MSGRKLPRRVRSTLLAEDLRTIRALAAERAGLGLDEDDLARLERAVRERMRELGDDDVRDYVRRLSGRGGVEAGPGPGGEAEQLVEELLNHETYFFREAEQLRAFAEHVLPDLAATCRDGRLHLWSAGCSTGEEAYTLAMMVLESGLFDGWQVRVLGTDLSRRVLAVARRGQYRATSFRQTPGRWLERYFTRVEDRHEVVARVRALCHFAHLNLLDEARVPLVGQADAIFCRNVLIHLDDAARARVLTTLHERLRPGGWLLLGHSEGFLPAATPFRERLLGKELVYQRSSTSDVPPRSQPGSSR